MEIIYLLRIINGLEALARARQKFSLTQSGNVV
jgi:hypothetical protein